MNQAQDAPVRPGDILAGKYRVEKVLGMGAMGVVVAALHIELHERRAIKFMLPAALTDAEGVERFLREARAAVRLKSQHVAKVQDVGRLETGAPYIVMEYLEGADLKSLLDARGALPCDEAVRYLLQACEAIAEAHALGIVHRDLKPANLFLTTGVGGVPCVKVLDFGIAKIVGGSGPALDMTATTQLLGTPLYMSPEQMRSTRNVDARTDIWALGVILYRMLAGRPPFSGSTVTEICAAVIGDQPDSPAALRRDVPPALEACVMRCLEKNPARRFATATELAAALAPFAASGPPAPWATPPAGFVQAPVPASTAASSHAPPTAVMTASHAGPIAASPAVGASTAGSVAPAGVAAAAPGQSTAQASTWTQPEPTAVRPRSVTGWILGGVTALAVVVGAILALRARAPAGTPLAPSQPQQAEATSPSQGAPSPSAAAPSAPLQVVSAASAAAPSSSGSADAAPAGASSASRGVAPPRINTRQGPRPTKGPAAPKPADAFGDERR